MLQSLVFVVSCHSDGVLHFAAYFVPVVAFSTRKRRFQKVMTVLHFRLSPAFERAKKKANFCERSRLDAQIFSKKKLMFFDSLDCRTVGQSNSFWKIRCKAAAAYFNMSAPSLFSSVFEMICSCSTFPGKLMPSLIPLVPKTEPILEFPMPARIKVFGDLPNK